MVMGCHLSGHLLYYLGVRLDVPPRTQRVGPARWERVRSATLATQPRGQPLAQSPPADLRRWQGGGSLDQHCVRRPSSLKLTRLYKTTPAKYLGTYLLAHLSKFRIADEVDVRANQTVEHEIADEARVSSLGSVGYTQDDVWVEAEAARRARSRAAVV